MTAHAGLVVLRTPRGWRGALIEGPSGVGKSDLALRCVAAGFQLVADDRVVLWASGGRLYGRAPDALFGLIEHRGQAVRHGDARRLGGVDLVVACGETLERIPETAVAERAGVMLPMIALRPMDASAPARLTAALLNPPAFGAGLATPRR